MRKGAAERVGRAYRRGEGGGGLEENGENSGRKKGGGGGEAGGDGAGRRERRSEDDPGVHRTFIQLTDSSRVTGGQEIVLMPIHTPHTYIYIYMYTRALPRSSAGSYGYQRKLH